MKPLLEWKSLTPTMSVKGIVRNSPLLVFKVNVVASVALEEKKKNLKDATQIEF